MISVFLPLLLVTMCAGSGEVSKDWRLEPIKFSVIYTDHAELHLLHFESANWFSEAELRVAVWDLQGTSLLADTAQVKIPGVVNREIRSSITAIELPFDKSEYWITTATEVGSFHGLSCGLLAWGKRQVLGCPISAAASGAHSASSNRTAWLIERFRRIRFEYRQEAVPVPPEDLRRLLRELKPTSIVVYPFRQHHMPTKDAFDAGRFISDAVDKVLTE